MTSGFARWVALSGLVLIGAGSCRSTTRSVPVWTDGVPDEWASVAPAAADAEDDVPAASAVDLRSIRVMDDGRFLHFLLDVGRPVTAQGMVGHVEIVLDGDGDPDTGITFAGVDGADLVVILSRPGPDPLMHGAGVGVRLATDGEMGPIVDVIGTGLLVTPTHSSDVFEIRLERGVELGDAVRLGALSGSTLTGTVRFLAEGNEIDALGPFRHIVGTGLSPAAPRIGIDDLAKPDGTVRMVVWNVSDGSFRRRTAAFARVLDALSPDVVLLDEVYADITAGALDEFFGQVRNGEGIWSWWLAEGGGPQRTLVGALGLPFSGESGMARVDHDLEGLDDWREAAEGWAAATARARLEAEGGISATGAWVEVEGLPILFVPVDLQSAGHDGSPQDRLRELQAAAVNRAIRAVRQARGGSGGPVVIGGDASQPVSSAPSLRPGSQRLRRDGCGARP